MAMWARTASPFGEVSGDGLNYLDTTFESLSATLTGTFGDMVNNARQEVRNHRVFRAAVAAGRRLRYSGTTDEVRELFTVGEMQQAPEVMQPLLTAMPEYRKLYNDNMAAGFEDGYSQHDRFRGSALMKTDFNFRQVTNGLSTKYDEDRLWMFTTPIEMDGVLKKADQIDVMKVWGRMGKIDWDDEDPLSSYNASCG